MCVLLHTQEINKIKVTEVFIVQGLSYWDWIHENIDCMWQTVTYGLVLASPVDFSGSAHEVLSLKEKVPNVPESGDTHPSSVGSTKPWQRLWHWWHWWHSGRGALAWAKKHDGERWRECRLLSCCWALLLVAKNSPSTELLQVPVSARRPRMAVTPTMPPPGDETAASVTED